ncbi:amidase [Demetria terragena]|uniref:amidase n=1 Tax=Demetria terragena TaxID=63959 RepID=UPI00036927AE|nr:amidase [Demetria terragena]
MTDLSMVSATELTDGFRSGEWTPVDALEAAMGAVEKYDSAVNAITMVDEQYARARAEDSAARWSSGDPISATDGIPLTVKDMMPTQGWPTYRGSNLIGDEGPWDLDAPFAARLREAGQVIFGKNTTPEFGWKGVTDSLRHGVTRNAWNPDRTSGGSSGGAASATALGMGTWSVGTDGGGSVRIPGAFSGIVALKPTYGQVPVFPASPYGTLSHIGPMTRSVRDCALLLDVISGPDSRDWSAMPTRRSSWTDGLGQGVAGMRLAYSANLGYGHNAPGVDAAFHAALDVLRGLGAEIDEVELGLDDPVEAFHTLWFTGAAKVVDAYGDGARERIDPGLRSAIEQFGDGATAQDYLDATAVRAEWGRRTGELHDTYAALLTPTMPIPAFAAGQPAPDGWHSQLWTSWCPYTYPFNMTQQPALTVPCGFTGEGLPLGLQVVAARHQDATTLRVGHAYESGTNWHHLMPPLLSERRDRP